MCDVVDEEWVDHFPYLALQTIGGALHDALFLRAARLSPTAALRFCAPRCEELGILAETVRRAPFTARDVGLGDHPDVVPGLRALGY